MEITKNAMENMMGIYVDHKKMMIKYEDEYGFDELQDNANYMFHKGCCGTAENWIRAAGVSPQCNFITEKLYG